MLSVSVFMHVCSYHVGILVHVCACCQLRCCLVSCHLAGDCCSSVETCFRGLTCCSVVQQCGTTCCPTGQVCLNGVACCDNGQVCGTVCWWVAQLLLS